MEPKVKVFSGQGRWIDVVAGAVAAICESGFNFGLGEEGYKSRRLTYAG